tara:strand:+ start:513 stop:902 length:390 start_codon:yes stop_codon:yes gene_type:complete
MELVYDIESSDSDNEKNFKKPELVGRCSYKKCGIFIFLDKNDNSYRHFNDGGGIAIRKGENYFCSPEHLMQYLDYKHRALKVKLKETSNFDNLFKLNMKGKGKLKTKKRKFRKKRKTKKRKIKKLKKKK